MSNDQIQIKEIENRPEQTADTDSISLSTDKMLKLGQRLSSRFKELRASRERQTIDEDRAEDFATYFLMEPAKTLPYEGYPNLRCVLPRIIVDTLHANNIFSFTGQEGEFKVQPNFLKESQIETSKRAAKFMTYQINKEAGLYEAFDKADWDDENYGVGYLEPVYKREFRFETRKVTKEVNEPVIDPVTGQVRDVKRRKKTKTERVKKTVFDGIKVEALDVESVLYSPLIENLDKAVKTDVVFKFARHRFETIKNKAKKIDGEEPFFIPAQVEKVKQAVTHTILNENPTLLRQVQEEYDGVMPEQILDAKFLDLAEAHLWDDINNDGWPEKVKVIFEVDSGVILRASLAENRIVELKSRPVRGRGAGESVRKAGAPLFLEWEAIHNARVAKGQWANLPIGFYTLGGRFNPENITLTPGQFYGVEDANQISFPQLGQVDTSFLNEERLILDYIERLFATGQSIQGVASPSGETTATETLSTQQRAGIRLQNPIKRKQLALNKLLGHMWDLNRICAPESKEFRVLGDTANNVPMFDRVSKEDFDQNLDFSLDLATIFDVQLARDTALLVWRTFSQDPAFLQDPAARDFHLRRTFNSLGVPLKMNQPEQAQVISPEEERQLIMRGDDVEPKLGANTDAHMRNHTKFMQLEEFVEWKPEQKLALIALVEKYKIQKRTLQKGGLNQSGLPQNPVQPGKTPAFTANRNPTQTFNTARVGESPNSQRQNLRNPNA